MLNVEDIRKQIVAGLNTSPKPAKAILFGSYAQGTPHDESDIDLVVILDRAGMSESYRALINNRMEISKRLRALKRKYPVDILVYTMDEWDELRASNSSFIQKIETDGIAIL